MPDPIPTSRIVNEFQRLGVSPQEAKVYLALLQEGGLSGYRLSKNTGIPSSKIYTLLNQLLERGFVLAADTRPVKYFPRPPADLLQELQEGLVSTCASLSTSLEAIQQRHKSNHEELAHNITGRPNVIHRAKEVIEASRENIFLAVWAKELRPLRRVLTQAVKRGVKLRVVAYGPTNFDKGEIYFHRPSDYLFRERGERRFVLTSDNSQAVIANIGENGSNTGLWTTNHGLVTLFRDFVIHEIYIILVERTYPQQIKELAGRDWEKLRLF